MRGAVQYEDGSDRICPLCGCPVRIVNQRRQHGPWDNRQALKVGCTNKKCEGYLRDIDERPPFKQALSCQIDKKTRYRRIKKRRSEVWQCPKHPKECKSYKVVPGDAEL